MRDPRALGERLLSYFDTLRGDPRFARAKAHEIADLFYIQTRPYSANPSCIEKYGYPQDLPETPF